MVLWSWFWLSLCSGQLTFLILECCLMWSLLRPTAASESSVLCPRGCIEILPKVKLDQIYFYALESDHQWRLGTPLQFTIFQGLCLVLWICSLFWRSEGSASIVNEHQIFQENFQVLLLGILFSCFDRKLQSYWLWLHLRLDSRCQTVMAYFAYDMARAIVELKR